MSEFDRSFNEPLGESCPRSLPLLLLLGIFLGWPFVCGALSLERPRGAGSGLDWKFRGGEVDEGPARGAGPGREEWGIVELVGGVPEVTKLKGRESRFPFCPYWWSSYMFPMASVT